MTINRTFLSNYISELYSVDTPEERFQVYEKYIRLMGFSGATYTFAPRMQWEALPDLPAIFLHTKDYPVGFLQDYEKERFDRKDFTVRKVLDGDTAPMDWREHELQNSLTEDEIGLIHYAKEKYGIKNAISIPTLFDEKGAAGASVISFEEDAVFSELKQIHLDTLVRATRVFHDTNFSDLGKFVLPIYQSLSAREIDILYYKVSGKPMKNIEDDTGINSTVAARALHDLKRKLGKVNNDKLIYLFVLLTSINGIPPEHPQQEE